MEPVSGLNQIVENLRRQIAQGERVQGLSRSHKHAKTKTQTKSASKPTTEQLQTRIAERIKQLDCHDDNFIKKSTDLILESVLLVEFGDQFLNDPRFSEMVQDIRTMLLDNEKTSTELKGLVNSYIE